MNNENRNDEYDLFEFLADEGITNKFKDNVVAQFGKEKGKTCFDEGFNLGAIITAFDWGKTNEGYKYWLKISNKWQAQFEQIE